MKIFFLSLGCDKNLSDSEHMLGILSKKGYEFTDDETEAEVIVINTCAFIGDAKEESIQEILRLAEYKEIGKCRALLVTGCLSERYQKELREELPEIDGALGIASWDRIAEAIEEALQGNHPHYFADHNELCLSDNRVLTSGGFYAYIKIAEGCDKYCTYCSIPAIRGSYRSVPMELLMKEAEELAAQGVTELILVAQETTLYGKDLYGKKSLPDLLRKFSAIEGISWIRILYCYPEEITDELIEEIRTNPKVVHYLDIPIQHASDEVLKKMNRRTNRRELYRQIRKLRTAIPDIALRTTLISGFPGETEEDFCQMQTFVKRVCFDRLGVFAYSQEEGTIAGDMPDQVPQELKEERRDVLMQIQQRIAFAASKAMVGKTVQVVIEGRLTEEDHMYVGRTYKDAPDVDGLIFVHADDELMTGMMIEAKVTGASGYDLTGELV